jgi:hypothetical protein
VPGIEMFNHIDLLCHTHIQEEQQQKEEEEEEEEEIISELTFLHLSLEYIYIYIYAVTWQLKPEQWSQKKFRSLLGNGR